MILMIGGDLSGFFLRIIRWSWRFLRIFEDFSGSWRILEGFSRLLKELVRWFSWLVKIYQDFLWIVHIWRFLGIFQDFSGSLGNREGFSRLLKELVRWFWRLVMNFGIFRGFSDDLEGSWELLQDCWWSLRIFQDLWGFFFSKLLKEFLRWFWRLVRIFQDFLRILRWSWRFLGAVTGFLGVFKDFSGSLRILKCFSRLQQIFESFQDSWQFSNGFLRLEEDSSMILKHLKDVSGFLGILEILQKDSSVILKVLKDFSGSLKTILWWSWKTLRTLQDLSGSFRILQRFLSVPVNLLPFHHH